VIVLDSFSSDRTEEICRNLGVKFYQKKFEGYGRQKRAAVELAQYDYILSIDADEFLSEGLVQEIGREKIKGLKSIYSLPRLTNYCDHWVRFCGWYPDRKIRLWHKEFASWNKALVHELVVPNSKEIHVNRLKNDILHYSYKSTEEHLIRIEHYTDLHARRYFDEGKKVFPFKKYLSSIWKFINVLILRLGFLDGKAGFKISWYSGLYQYRKYEKLENLIRKSSGT